MSNTLSVIQRRAGVLVFACVISAVMLGLVSAGAFAADSNAVVHPDPLSAGIRSGQTQEISLRVENVKNMYGIEFQLKFDPKVLQVQDADNSKEGTQIAVGDWLSKGFVAANQADNAKGTITFAATLLNPAPPLNGDGTVATITFHAKADGTSPLKISKALLATRDATEIKSDVQDGTIGVSASGQAPVVQNSNNGSNKTTNTNTTTSNASGLSTTSLVLIGAAGVGVLAFLVAGFVLLGIVFLRKRA
jgi:Cohesin domain